jgi:hypothetical protein
VAESAAPLVVQELDQDLDQRNAGMVVGVVASAFVGRRRS